MAKKTVEKVEFPKSRVFFCGVGEADDNALEGAAITLENDGRYTVYRHTDKIVIIWNDEEATPIHPYFIVSGWYGERDKKMPKLVWGEGWTGQKLNFKNYWVTLV